MQRALACHEEALRVCSMCKKLRNIEVLQEILSVAYKRSRLKFPQQDWGEDFLSLVQAPDILRKNIVFAFEKVFIWNVHVISKSYAHV